MQNKSIIKTLVLNLIITKNIWGIVVKEELSKKKFLFGSFFDYLFHSERIGKASSWASFTQPPSYFRYREHSSFESLTNSNLHFSRTSKIKKIISITNFQLLYNKYIIWYSFCIKIKLHKSKMYSII